MLFVHLYGQFTATCPCSPQSWQCRVSFLLCLWFCPCFLLVTVAIGFAALGALFTSFLSFISPATRPFISSISTMPCPRSVWSFLVCSLASFVPLPSDRAHVFVWHVVARVRITLCHLRIVRTDISQALWCGSVVGHHFVDVGLQFLHDFVEPSRSRQELPFGVLHPGYAAPASDHTFLQNLPATVCFLRAARHPADSDGRPTAGAQVLATGPKVPWHPYHSGPALHCRVPSRSERCLHSTKLSRSHVGRNVINIIQIKIGVLGWILVFHMECGVSTTSFSVTLDFWICWFVLEKEILQSLIKKRSSAGIPFLHPEK